MSEQPPQPSGQLPRPGVRPTDPDVHGYDPDPEAPPMTAPRTARTQAAVDPGEARLQGSSRLQGEARVRDSAGDRLDQAADAARRLGHRVREQGGLAGRAEPVAYRVGDSLQSAASYVREHDVRSMREDVETGVRASPLKSLAIATVAGFVLGRMLR